MARNKKYPGAATKNPATDVATLAVPAAVSVPAPVPDPDKTAVANQPPVAASLHCLAWEYHRTYTGFSQLDNVLAELGAGGWELISTHWRDIPPSTEPKLDLIFKRPRYQP